MDQDRAKLMRVEKTKGTRSVLSLSWLWSDALFIPLTRKPVSIFFTASVMPSSIHSRRVVWTCKCSGHRNGLWRDTPEGEESLRSGGLHGQAWVYPYTSVPVFTVIINEGSWQPAIYHWKFIKYKAQVLVLIIEVRWLAKSKKVNADPQKAEPKLVLTKYPQASHTLLGLHLQWDTREQRRGEKDCQMKLGQSL